MSDNQNQAFQHLARPVKVLKSCRALVDRLLSEGLVIQLTANEQEQLLNFEQLTQTDYSPGEWSYLRIVSGLNVSAVAALNGCLALYRSGVTKPIYGQL
jgi:hypothetical protein